MPDADALARRLWAALPQRIAVSRWALGARAGAQRAVHRATQRPTVVHTLDELDAMLAMLDRAAAVSDDELRRGFGAFRMSLDRPMPADPFAEDYRRAVLQTYEWLHGGPYSPANEHTLFDAERALGVPFPYATGSCATVGDYLVNVGRIIRLLRLPPRSRVLELGPGWGILTVALAQMGHQVTAVDCSAEFAALIEARATQVGATVRAVVGDFSAVADLQEQFDAVVFFASFHHCTDHLRLLADLQRVVAPGGRLVFGAEPIERHFYAPWGLRLDGESLWAVRTQGWFELGFRTSYFLKALGRTGWRAVEIGRSDSGGGMDVVARRRRDLGRTGAA